MSVARTPQTREYSPFDITWPAFWSQPFDVRDEKFAQLRHIEFGAADLRYTAFVHGIKRLPGSRAIAGPSDRRDHAGRGRPH